MAVEVRVSGQPPLRFKSSAIGQVWRDRVRKWQRFIAPRGDNANHNARSSIRSPRMTTRADYEAAHAAYFWARRVKAPTWGINIDGRRTRRRSRQRPETASEWRVRRVNTLMGL